MLTHCDSKVELTFREEVLPVLQRHGLALERLSHDEHNDVLHVALRLPSYADRELRRRVLDELTHFEARWGERFMVSPSLIFADGDLDD